MLSSEIFTIGAFFIGAIALFLSAKFSACFRFVVNLTSYRGFIWRNSLLFVAKFVACAAHGFCSIASSAVNLVQAFSVKSWVIYKVLFSVCHNRFFLSKRCEMWKVHFCGCILQRGFCSIWRLSSKPFKGGCSAKFAPNKACSGQFATFRFAAFSRSKTFFRFVGWSAWQPAAKASRWALAHQAAREIILWEIARY